MCSVCKVKPRASLSAIVCSLECSIKRMNTIRNKTKKETAKKIISKRELNRTKINWQHEQCRPVFNKLRRLQEFKWFKDRSLDPTCISCGKGLGNDEWACGHYKTDKGLLRYDPINTYLQHNKRCNKELSADIYGTKTTHGYIKGILIRFGEEHGQAILNHCEGNRGVIKWIWQDMQAMRKEWNKEIKILERELDDF